MNRILFERGEIGPDGIVALNDFRAEHLRKVLRVEPGKSVKTGEVGGMVGTSEVLSVSPERILLRVNHNEPSEPPWVDLLLAVPRPKVLKRLWPQLAALGARRIFLLNAFKVEKFYFSSQWLQPEFYRPLLLEGLMQCSAAILPEVTVCQRFRPFMEDEFPQLFADQPTRLVAHPGSPQPPVLSGGGIPVVAIGPEGGWTDYELEYLRQAGFTRWSLGKRVLRTDTATIALLSVLDYIRV